MQIVREWTGSATSESLPFDNLLIQRAKQGDCSAMEALLIPHERPLFSLCCGILGCASEAEDAVQESFLRALRALPRFRSESGIQTWLYRIALNVCLEWNRARKQNAAFEDAPGSLPSPEASVLRNLRIADALRSMLPRYRAIWLLKELEGWSVSEIASAMRCNEKRIHNELYKARKMLVAWRVREQESMGDNE